MTTLPTHVSGQLPETCHKIQRAGYQEDLARLKISEWSGTPFSEDSTKLLEDASESEIALAWERHDSCQEVLSFLMSPYSVALAGKETFSFGWNGAASRRAKDDV